MGICFNSDFSLPEYVEKVILYLQKFLTHDPSILVATALFSSPLDHGDSLSRSLSKLNPCKLQCINNSVARILSNTRKYTSITRVHKKLQCFL